MTLNESVTNISSEEKKDTIREKLCSLFGEVDYEELIFFLSYAINSGDYDIVIFVVNKCYNLFKAINSIIPRKDNSAVIYCDEAIPFIKNSVSGKRILVVDDVYVHGRTINKIVEDLRFNKAIVDKRSFIISSETFDIDDDTQYSFVLETKAWREMSRKFIRLFYLLNQPNTLCRPMLQIYTKEKICNLDDAVRMFAWADIVKVDTFYKEQNYVIIPHKDVGMNILNNDDNVFFHLHVTNDNQSCIQIIPYIVFSSCDVSSFALYWKKINRLFSDKYERQAKDNDIESIGIFRLIQYALRLGNCYEFLKQSESVIKSHDIKQDDLQYCFSEEEHQWLSKPVYINEAINEALSIESTVPSENLEDFSLHQTNVNILFNKMNQILNQDNSHEFSLKLFHEFFFRMKVEDETSVFNYENKNQPIFILTSKLIDKTKNGIESIASWLSCMINSITGMKAYHDNDNSISLVSYAGEHAYIYLSYYYKDIIEALISHNQNLKDMEHELDIKEFVENLINGDIISKIKTPELYEVFTAAINEENPQLSNNLLNYLTDMFPFDSELFENKNENSSFVLTE